MSSDESDANVVGGEHLQLHPGRPRGIGSTLVGLAEREEPIIAGCLAQHFQEELLDSLPEAKAIVGTGDYQHIVDVLHLVEAGERVNRVSQTPTFVGDKICPIPNDRRSGRLLKVAEGCDYRRVLYIPHLRGNQRSRTIESIVAEAHQLAAQGVQELVLITNPTNTPHLYGRHGWQICYAPWASGIPGSRAYATQRVSPDVIAAYRDVPTCRRISIYPAGHRGSARHESPGGGCE